MDRHRLRFDCYSVLAKLSSIQWDACLRLYFSLRWGLCLLQSSRNIVVSACKFVHFWCRGLLFTLLCQTALGNDLFDSCQLRVWAILLNIVATQSLVCIFGDELTRNGELPSVWALIFLFDCRGHDRAWDVFMLLHIQSVFEFDWLIYSGFRAKVAARAGYRCSSLRVCIPLRSSYWVILRRRTIFEVCLFELFDYWLFRVSYMI